MYADYLAIPFVRLPVPRRRDAGIVTLGRAAAALLRGRQSLAALKRRWRKPCSGSGGPETPPEDNRRSDSIWDDPELWMLMIH